MPLAAGDRDGRLVAEDARADHRQRLGLRRVHLPRHDRGARLVLGQDQLAQPRARPGAEKTDIVGDLEQPRRSGVERAMHEHQRIVAGQRLELVGRGHEGKARQRGDPRRHGVGEGGMGVEPGAHGRAALRQRPDFRQCRLDPVNSEGDLRLVAGELLPQRQRRGVLRVGAADLDDIGEGNRLGSQRFAQCLQSRQKPLRDLPAGRDMHGRREGVVRGLAAIDVVVGMNRRLAASNARQDLVGASGQHLVDVHVGLGAGTRLPHHQREFVLQPAAQDLVGSRHDGVRPAWARVRPARCSRGPPPFSRSPWPR